MRKKLYLTLILCMAFMTCMQGNDRQPLQRAIGSGGIPETKVMPEERQTETLMLPVRKHSGLKDDSGNRMMKRVRKEEKRVVAEAVPYTSFRGILVSSKDWDKSDPAVGDYRFSAYSPVKELLHKSSDLYSTNGIVHFDGKYYVVVYMDILGIKYISSCVIDDTTYEILSTRSNLPGGCRATSMVYDPKDGEIYGCFLNDQETGHVLGTMDIASGKRHRIADLKGYLYAMAIDNQGRLLGINPLTGILYEVDRSTGALREIGNTGLRSVYATSGAIDPKSGRYYFATCNDSGSTLYEINTTTAAATKIYDFANEEEIMGMWVPMPPHADAAPAEAKSLTLDFKGISRTGNVNFTAPTTNFDESAGQGDLSYSLSCNDSVVMKGKIGWGENFSQEYTVPENGVYRFTVEFTNTAGTGPSRSVEQYIGQVRPSATDSVAVVRRGDCFDITWTPVESSKFGGEFNPKEVVYDVVRVHDGKKVASLTDLTAATDTFPEPGEQVLLSYSVIPVYREVSGDTVASSPVLYGYLTPPFKETFSKDRIDYVAGWEIADGDVNGTLDWKHDYSAGRMRVKSGSKSDFLSTPRVYLEPDKVYTLRYGISSYSSSKTASVSAYLADTVSIEAFKKKMLVDPDAVSTSSKTKYKYYEAEITVDKAGMYYIGFNSERGTGLYTYLDNVEIKAPAATSAPAEVKELRVSPDKSGKLLAAVSLKIPVLTLGGDTLTNVSRLEVKRGSKTVKTVMTPVAGSVVEFKDTVAESGKYSWTACCYNNAGRGAQASASAFVGVNIPSKVKGDVSIIETSVPGTVKAVWRGVRTDRDGAPLNTDKVKYHIVAPHGDDYLVKDLTDTTAVVKLLDPSQRDFVRIYVQSATEAGVNDTVVASNMIAVGMPYKMPVAESFPSQKNTLIWGIRRMNPLSDAGWSIEKDNMTVRSQDGDNGYVMFNSTYADQEALLTSGKINISGENPMLSFYYYALPNSDNELEVLVGKDTTFNSVRKIVVKETGQTGWVKVLVPMSAYKGQTMQFAFLGRCRNLTQIHIDNIRVATVASHDLSAGLFTVPGRLYTNRENEIAVEVINTGASSAAGYKVTLYAGKEKIGSENGKDLGVSESALVKFRHTPAVGYSSHTGYRAEIAYEADMNPADNTTEEKTAQIVVPDYPAVDQLSGKSDKQGVALEWKAVDGNGPAWIEDDAEECVPFSTGMKNSQVQGDNVGSWTMIDGDGSMTYGLSDGAGGVMNFPNATAPKAFMVYPYKEALVWNDNLRGADGSNNWYGCFASVQGSNDDWMISAPLSGRAQTVEFMARSLQSDYPEAFEVLYSTGSMERADFRKVSENGSVAAAWKRYKVDLPEGAKRFAIRCVSKDKFLFMVDNIGYEAYNPFPDIKLSGYNVYRDGKLITPKPVAHPTYMDASATADGSYTYRVSAVYDSGESRLSQPFVITVSGVKDPAAGKCRVVSGRGIIRVSGAEGMLISVMTPDGLTVAQERGDVLSEFRLHSGIYMVSVGATVHKVMVE